MTRIILGCSILVAVAGSHAGAADMSGEWGGTNAADRPILAVWRDTDWNTYAPKLRVAVWNDGRIIFSKDAPRWGTNLFLGRLQPSEIGSLKERVRATGVFELTRNSLLGPDDPVCCLLLDFGEAKQMLYWDEAGLGYYWKERPPVHGTLPTGNFRRCWAQVSRIALSLAPAEAHMVEKGFKGAPDSWYIKQPSQEEKKAPQNGVGQSP